MAHFGIEFDNLILAEGRYVNDLDDAGGETYLGISRKHHPYSNIWEDIDKYKIKYNKKELNKQLKSNTDITSRIANLYKNDYWDVFELDDVPNQKIAHQIFDDAVNRGITAATRLAEHIMGMTVTGKITKELLFNLKRYA